MPDKHMLSTAMLINVLLPGPDFLNALLKKKQYEHSFSNNLKQVHDLVKLTSFDYKINVRNEGKQY